MTVIPVHCFKNFVSYLIIKNSWCKNPWGSALLTNIKVIPKIFVQIWGVFFISSTNFKLKQVLVNSKFSKVCRMVSENYLIRLFIEGQVSFLNCSENLSRADVSLKQIANLVRDCFSTKISLKWLLLEQMLYKPQSFTKHLRLTLIFMWNCALREKFNFCFLRVFC